jgi:hypothetical protein
VDDYPARLADFLETTAGRARSLTVDRVAHWSKMAALGMVAGALGFLALIFLLIGSFRLIVSTGIGVTTTYGIIAGLLVAVGAFLWFKRSHPEDEA